MIMEISPLPTGVDDEPYVKKGVKLMRIHDSPITVMTTTLE